MVKCSLMTFSFAIILLLHSKIQPCGGELFLASDNDGSALSRIVEEHLPNNKALVTHLTKIMECLHARNLYLYFHDSLAHSPLICEITSSLHPLAAFPVIVTQYPNFKTVHVKEGIRSLIITVMPNMTINLEEDLIHVKKRMHSKFKYYFIVVIEQPCGDSETDLRLWLKNLFEIFWQRKHLNVVIIFWKLQLRIYTYNPFLPQFLVQLAVDNVNADYLFPDKAVNMRGHPLKVSLFVDDVRAITRPKRGDICGIDGFVTSLVIDRMNATLDLHPFTGRDPYGDMANGTTTGTLRIVAKGSVDVSFNARFLIYSDFRNTVEPTGIYGRDDLCFLVPSSKLLPQFTNLFRSFDIYVWICIILIFLTVLLSVIWIKWIENKKELRTSNRLCYLSFLRCHFNQTITKVSRTLRERLVLVSWIFYTIVITNAYLAHLASNLMLKISYPQIDTLDAFEESNLNVITLPKYANLIARNLNETHAHYNNLIKRINAVTFEQFYRELNKSNTSVAYAHKSSFLKHEEQKKEHIVRDRSIYHFVTQCPVPFFVVYIVKYGSPYLATINTILQRSQDVGLAQHWEQYMIMRQKIKQGRFQKHSHAPIPLRINHMQAAFYILVIGLLFALTVFIYELYVAKKFPIWFLIN
ncbi:ionotropic receptor 85a [Sergentomyia squamirostris]